MFKINYIIIIIVDQNNHVSYLGPVVLSFNSDAGK